MRQLVKLSTMAAAVWALAACVTINIYFPAAAAEKAADRVIENVWGEDAQTPPANDPSDPPAERSEDLQSSHQQPGWAQTVLGWLIPAAHAAEADIDVDSPAIRRLEASMRKRHAQLERFYEAGAIGLTQDGLVDVRDLGAVGLRERSQLHQLVAEENRDRNALYREVARANGHPEWEDQIREVFARRWISKAPKGWWYKDEKGKWKQK